MRTLPHPPIPPDVVLWRRRVLDGAGFPPALADHLAADPSYDLHGLLELVSHGCPPELAARIRAPL